MVGPVTRVEKDCLVLKFDRLILESAIHWMALGRPVCTRVPKEPCIHAAAALECCARQTSGSRVSWSFQVPSSEWLRTTVFSVVLEFDRLILESASYWMGPGRPFNTRVPKERRGGRSCTTYERRLRASNQRNARVKGVRGIALKWRKQQKERYCND